MHSKNKGSDFYVNEASTIHQALSSCKPTEDYCLGLLGGTGDGLK